MGNIVEYCKGCYKLEDPKTGEFTDICPVYADPKKKTRLGCAFNYVEEVKQEKIRVGQQKQRKRR